MRSAPAGRKSSSTTRTATWCAPTEGATRPRAGLWSLRTCQGIQVLERAVLPSESRGGRPPDKDPHRQGHQEVRLSRPVLQELFRDPQACRQVRQGGFGGLLQGRRPRREMQLHLRGEHDRLVRAARQAGCL